MKYRSRSDIIAMILQTVLNGATKTKIMYKAYLSYTQVKEYLIFLQDNNLIKYEEGQQIYRISEKGIDFLEIYDKMNVLITSKIDDKYLRNNYDSSHFSMER